MADGSDIGFTHIALVCTDADETIDFYMRFGGMKVIHDRTDDDTRVFWLSDLRRAFAIVFLESREPVQPLGPFGHLGVCLNSREEVDRMVDMAKSEGRKTSGPNDSGPPVGYWAFIADPDGHTLELSHGQSIELAVEEIAGAS